MRAATPVVLGCLMALVMAQDEASEVPVATPLIGNFAQAFAEAFGVIMATEIGDRTFFIAAIMAMRHSRLVVWSGAVAALAVMTVLSTLVGHVAPLLIPRQYTQYAAGALFLFFGVKMLREGFSIEHAGASEELEEVEGELMKKEEDTPADEEAASLTGEAQVRGRPLAPPPPPLSPRPLSRALSAGNRLCRSAQPRIQRQYRPVLTSRSLAPRPTRHRHAAEPLGPAPPGEERDGLDQQDHAASLHSHLPG